MDNQQPLTPEQKQKVKKAKVVLWLGLTTIVVIGIVIAVYFLFVREAVAPTVNGNVNSVINANSMVNISSAVDINDWQLYSNNEFGYAVSYPLDWSASSADNTSSLVAFNPSNITVGAKTENQLEIIFTMTNALDKTSDIFIRGIASKIGTVYELDGQSTAISIPYGDYFIQISWPKTITDDAIQRSIANSFTYTGTVLIKEASSTLPYQNSALKIKFNYPSAWWPVVGSRSYLEGEGGNMYVDFTKSEGAAVGVRFSLMYSTIDYAPGREIWQGEILSQYDKENGLNKLCSVEPANGFSWGNDIRDCKLTKLSGKWQVEYFTRLDNLGGESTNSFVKVYAFQTDNQDYPVGVLALFLPDSNNIDFIDTKTDVENAPLGPKDQANIVAVYNKLINKQADQETNSLLTQFDSIRRSFGYQK